MSENYKIVWSDSAEIFNFRKLIDCFEDKASVDSFGRGRSRPLALWREGEGVGRATSRRRHQPDIQQIFPKSNDM